MIPKRVRLVHVNVSGPAGDAAARTAELVQAVSAARGQAVALQGAARRQVMEVAEALPGFGLAHGGRKWREGAHHAVLLVKEGDVNVDKAFDVPLSDGDDPRVACLAVLSDPEHKERKLLFASAAVEPEHPRRRLDETSVLIRAVETEATAGRLGAVIAGSFFEDPDQAVYRMLTGRRTHKGVTGSFRDSFRMVGAKGPAGEGGWLDPQAGQRVRSDWAMVTAAEVQDARFIRPPEGEWKALAHTPVLVEVLLQEPLRS